MKRAGLFALGGSALAALGWLVACESTEYTPPGVGPGGSGGPVTTPGGGGSGIDAAVPETAIDCGPRPATTEPFTKQALLGAASACAAWQSCTFLNTATAMRKSVKTWADGPTDATRAAAGASWREAMRAWSSMELFQFGPVAPKSLDSYQGRGLRTFVHPWPDLNRCQVDTQVVQKTYLQGWDFVFPNGRGLFALETLLFYPGTDTACLSNSTTAQTWATKTPSQLLADKTAYGVAVAENLAALALEIQNVWAPTGENFGAKLLAGEGYGSEQEALNVVAYNLMYLDEEIKDFKLASLAGLSTSPPTPETPFAGMEVENVRENLHAFRALYQGCGEGGAGLGFDDWLAAAGQSALANDIGVALDQAQAAADAFPPFSSATQPQFRQLYETLKVLTDLVKADLFGSASPLNLKLPASASSDTD